ncbi:ACHB3-like protein [Mya arenaria]|uniref:ACHB3-like protein n=1 Tax=Mya arenaria TaxID=6604 RepID=A0ABY7FVP9_MYAAR|nr:neuronal acetylcholine receptor subunit beta-3-like [Mya arenaria]WAR24916.1 ACHB3-like protein [Mya arenaria]
MRICLIVIWTSSCIAATHTSHLDTNTTSLYTHLLHSYEKDERPCSNCSKPLHIAASFYLTSLIDMDELTGQMVTVGYFKLTWLDTRLMWRPQDFGGTASIFVSSTKIWVPTMTMGNPSLQVSTLNSAICPVRVLFNGTVIWAPGDVFHSRCEFNIYKYPFDNQTCFLSFIVWPYMAEEIAFVASEKNVSMPFYNENGEWALVQTSVDVQERYSMSIVFFTFSFRRLSEFFVVNVILPCVLLCLCNCLVFLIPLESGERISYTITVLLSFAVLMTLVSDNIPKTSAPMSLLCYYLFLLFFGSVLAMITVAINSYLFYKDANMHVPFVLRNIVLFCRKSSFSPRDTNHKEILTLKSNGKEGEHSRFPESKGACVSWIDVAKCMDRISLYIFAVYFITLSIAMVVLLYH